MPSSRTASHAGAAYGHRTVRAPPDGWWPSPATATWFMVCREMGYHTGRANSDLNVLAVVSLVLAILGGRRAQTNGGSVDSAR